MFFSSNLIFAFLMASSSGLLLSREPRVENTMWLCWNAVNAFAWIGSFSAGGMIEDNNAAYPALDSKVNAKLRLLWIACGTEDPLIDANRKG